MLSFQVFSLIISLKSLTMAMPLLNEAKPCYGHSAVVSTQALLEWHGAQNEYLDLQVIKPTHYTSFQCEGSCIDNNKGPNILTPVFARPTCGPSKYGLIDVEIKYRENSDSVDWKFEQVSIANVTECSCVIPDPARSSNVDTDTDTDTSGSSDTDIHTDLDYMYAVGEPLQPANQFEESDRK